MKKDCNDETLIVSDFHKTQVIQNVKIADVQTDKEGDISPDLLVK